jgi:hypothetical protein
MADGTDPPSTNATASSPSPPLRRTLARPHRRNGVALTRLLTPEWCSSIVPGTPHRSASPRRLMLTARGCCGKVRNTQALAVRPLRRLTRNGSSRGRLDGARPGRRTGQYLSRTYLANLSRSVCTEGECEVASILVCLSARLLVVAPTGFEPVFAVRRALS